MNSFFNGTPYNPIPGPGSGAQSRAAVSFSDLVQRIVQSNSGKQRAVKPVNVQIEGRIWEDCRNLAEDALSNHNYSRAEALLLKAVAKAEELPVKDWRRVYGLETLLSLYYSQNRFDEAEVFAERYSNYVQAVYGVDHFKTGDAFNFLASIYFSLGQYEKAAEYGSKAFSIYKHGQFPDQTKLAMVFNNLAVINHQYGDFVSAEDYFRRAYNLRVELFGEDHPSTRKVVESYNEMVADRESHEAARKIINRLLD